MADWMVGYLVSSGFFVLACGCCEGEVLDGGGWMSVL